MLFAIRDHHHLMEKNKQENVLNSLMLLFTSVVNDIKNETVKALRKNS